MTMPQLAWDWGPAYDLFVSLFVLHEPADFGVRGSWAAGVRARLPNDEREMLEQTQGLVHVPVHWIYNLPPPKDTLAVLRALAQIPAAERLATLTLPPGEYPAAEEVLREVAAHKSWDEEDLGALREAYRCEESGLPPRAKMVPVLDWWARAEEFGTRYLEALRVYHEVFFAEEEARIRSVLQEALARAQDRAGQVALPVLLEELSQGVSFDELPETEEWILAPSYWSTPLVIFGNLGPGRMMWLFGARPPDASLVPGEVVPDAMLRTLKALSDPTRLRILHYLAQEPQAPADLARRLRLRAPTVTHHLKTLRLAGLVRLTLGEGKHASRYAARTEAVAAAFDAVQRFLQAGGP